MTVCEKTCEFKDGVDSNIDQAQCTVPLLPLESTVSKGYLDITSDM